jgi:hypothetical protein
MVIALFLWLLAVPGLVWIVRFESKPDAVPSGTANHSVPVLLDDSDVQILEPVLALDDQLVSLGSGEGHICGTDTVDPSLPEPAPQRETGIDVLPQMLVPEVGPTCLPMVPQRTEYRTDLPVAIGGNGAAQGTGRDSGRGGDQVSRGLDYAKLIRPVYHVRPVYPDEQIDLEQSKVLVKVLINQKGRVVSAEAQSGQRTYYGICVEAAKHWVFSVPKDIRSQAPFTWHILFYLDPDSSS